jgi:hypothetical protein
MDKPAPAWRVVVGGLVYGLIVVLAVMFSPGLLVAALVLASLVSPFIGAALIWSIVRWTNRRGDPRHAKLPPE